MNRSPVVLAVRAISAEFAKRIYMPVLLILAVSALVLIGLLIWFVSMSAWWWLALAPVLVVSFVLTIAAVLVGFLLSLLNPRQTKAQQTKVKSFVDAIQNSSDAIQTPKFIILFRLVKDTISPGERGFVKELSSNATTLRTGFQEIVASFR